MTRNNLNSVVSNHKLHPSIGMERFYARKRLHFGNPKTRTTKICSTCKMHKDFSNYYKFGMSVDGRQTKCKDCCREYDRRYKADVRAKDRKKFLQKREWLEREVYVY